MTAELGVGIIGCGKQAEKHIASLQKLPGLALAAADTDAERAQALAHRFGIAAMAVEEIFSNPDMQAVVICTPTPTHLPLIKQAAATGKTLFCEKPLCATPAEGHAIAQACKDAGKPALVGYIYRYAPVFQTARDILRQAEDTSPLGRPVMAHLRIGGRGSHRLWKHRKETGGGAINEMLVHMLDLALWLFGRPEEARLLRTSLLRPRREIAGRLEEADAEDFVLAELILPSGMPVYIEADLLTPGFSQHMEIQGERGSFFGSVQPELPGRLFCSQASGNYKPGWNMLSVPPVNLLDAQMAHFVRLAQGTDKIPLTGIGDSLALLDILQRLQKENGQ